MRLIWVHRLTGEDAGGDSVLDFKLVRELRARHTVTMIGAPRNTQAYKLGGAATHLSTPDMFGFGNSDTVRAIIAALGQGADAIVFSHEHLDRIAWTVKAHAAASGVPIVGVRHNVTSDAMAEILAARPLIASVWSARARLQERRAFAHLFDGLVAISQRDQRLIEALSGRNDIALSIPGAPPATAIAADAGLAEALVLLGTFKWGPKARDVRRFAEEYAALPERPRVYAEAELEPADTAALAPESAKLDFSRAIRFGVITDRFASGHKLKTSAYLMNNCVVLSYAPVAEDFAFSPHASRFIRQIRHASEIAAIIAEFKAAPIGELRAQLAAVKADIAAHLAWPKQAEPLERMIARLVGVRASVAAPAAEALTMQSA